jgi:hypothetical protein
MLKRILDCMECYRLDSCGSVEGSGERGNEPSCAKKCWEIFA